MDDACARTALAALVCFAACCANRSLYVQGRAWAQRRLLPRVHAGVGTVLAVQRWESRLLTAFFELTAFSVSVPFYGSTLPLLAWAGEVALVRKLTMLMTLVMWIGNACKDGLCLPRPLALSKAVRVIAHTHDSKENSDEYGLPSSHVANCFAFFAYLLVHTSLHTHATAWALLAAWTAVVALGRLYLGMHTPVDLAAGAVVGSAALAAWAPLHVAWDAWLLSASASRVAGVHAALCVALATCYPSPPTFTPSFNFVTFFSGVTAGLAVGGARAPALRPGALELRTLHGVATLLARGAVSAPVILATRAAFRAAATRTWPLAAAVRDASRRVTSALLPRLPRPKSPCVVDAPPQRTIYDGEYLWIRFWCYAGVGWGVSEPGMLALRACGLL